MHIYLRDRLILVSAGAALIINILLWMILAGKFGASGELIALHFNVVFGIDFLGKPWQVYQIPAAGLLVLAVNFWLGDLLYRQQKILSYFLNFASLAMQLVLALGAASLLVLID